MQVTTLGHFPKASQGPQSGLRAAFLGAKHLISEPEVENGNVDGYNCNENWEVLSAISARGAA